MTGVRLSRGSSLLGVFSSRVTGVTRWVTWREIALCYLVCRSSRPSHSPECSNSSRHPCSSVSKPEVLVGREVGRRRLPFQASLATPVLVRPSCSE
ncbi:hypothetical protein Taro_047642 [Colocasia esculenta]|uniref:Uncharacterized protein n=1 Tax=Colocasia esculenta TaxID=4460 RepID=A0A843X189_COLES|nr:hypothetical protein [Colocasia esculenta]